ncbi:hypothetical protein CNMCM8927_008706 [Aspergillus lentulus]|uniref:Benzoate 4-monooxygenase n=1 Tax=Aspergillus lentulus TaxID=293939 RepID=A0AAN6BS78_ASPLE|nr:hypothetical protein CNMCM8927_008706 [Aspergillus lentulus]
MAFALILAVVLAYLCARPFIVYFYDAKGLRKYPDLNPLSGITSLAYVWEHSNHFRTRHLYLKHRKHPVIRVGPNVLSFADVRAIKDIYGHGTPCRKDDVYTLTAGSHAHILNTIDREDHNRKRRMLSHAFATRNLERWEFKIADKIGKLIAQLDRRCTAPLSDRNHVSSEDLTLDFTLWSNLFTVDAIADLALSEQLNLLDSGTSVVKVDDIPSLKFIDSLHGGNYITSLFVGAVEWFAVLKAVSSIASPQFRAQWDHGRNFGRIVSALTSRRLEKHKRGDQLGDLFACLMEDNKGNARGLERGELKAETNVLLDAGSDTTAIALTHALYYLIKTPHAMATLRKEVAGAFSEEPTARYASVKNLPYLKACLEESLRLSPPVSRGLERRTPPQGMRIMGEQIPGNVGVSVPVYVAHRDPAIFPEPELYRPERWLESEEKAKQMREAFIPFSTGARGCIGRNITMIEQQLVIATLVHRYEFALQSDRWSLQHNEAFLLWTCPMPLKIWRRDIGSPTS